MIRIGGWNTIVIFLFAVLQTVSAQEAPYNQNMLPNAFPQAEREYAVQTDELRAVIPQNIFFDFRAAAVIDSIYDTGLVGSEPRFLPSTIALDGTAAARGRGKFQMTGTSTLVELGARAEGLAGRPRAYTTLDFVPAVEGFDVAGADVRLRDAFGVIDIIPGLTLVGGQTFTTFSDNRALPFSIVNDGTPAGAVFRRQAQLRLVRDRGNGFNTAIAIENPTSDDFVLPEPSGSDAPDRNVALQRYPDVVARWQWIRPSGEQYEIDRFQIAGLLRGLGYEEVNGAEHFVLGWGISAMARFRIYCENNIQIGAVVGEGLGRYLFGFGADADQVAAGPDAANDLVAVGSFGAHVGYQHHLTDILSANLAYGYAHADTTDAMVGSIETTHNAWANIVFAVSPKFHMALEYQYGYAVATGQEQGENNRIQLTFTYR